MLRKQFTAIWVAKGSAVMPIVAPVPPRVTITIALGFASRAGVLRRPDVEPRFWRKGSGAARIGSSLELLTGAVWSVEKLTMVRRR
jgi:hypothetical protein